MTRLLCFLPGLGEAGIHGGEWGGTDVCGAGRDNRDEDFHHVLSSAQPGRQPGGQGCPEQARCFPMAGTRASRWALSLGSRPQGRGPSAPAWKSAGRLNEVSFLRCRRPVALRRRPEEWLAAPVLLMGTEA